MLSKTTTNHHRRFQMYRP